MFFVLHFTFTLANLQLGEMSYYERVDCGLLLHD